MNKKGFANLVLVGVVFVLVALAGYFAWSKKSNNVNTAEPLLPPPAQVDNSKYGLKVTSLSPNAKVSFPLTIKGVVDNSNTQTPWKMFEGQAGTAQLYYDYGNGNWKVLGVSVPIKVANWMTDSTTFTTTLNFNNEGIGLPSGTPMKIIFTEEDASGMGLSRIVEFSIVLK